MKNTYGGGANTNQTGLAFEKETSLNDALIEIGYHIKDNEVYDIHDNFIGLSVSKYDFYKKFLEIDYIGPDKDKLIKVNYKQYNSKRWLPDEAFVNNLNKTVYIIEKKYQEQSGSIDEKLPNCHFKKLEYEKLCNPKGYNVEFIYVLSDWFKQNQYKDILDYIKHVECQYYFNNIPLEYLELRK